MDTNRKEPAKTNDPTLFHKKDVCKMTYQDNDLGFGQAGVEHLSDGQDSSSDLLCRVLVIVGSYPQHDHLGRATRNFCLRPTTTRHALAKLHDAATSCPSLPRRDVHSEQQTLPETVGSIRLPASQRTRRISTVKVYSVVHHRA